MGFKGQCIPWSWKEHCGRFMYLSGRAQSFPGPPGGSLWPQKILTSTTLIFPFITSIICNGPCPLLFHRSGISSTLKKPTCCLEARDIWFPSLKMLQTSQRSLWASLPRHSTLPDLTDPVPLMYQSHQSSTWQMAQLTNWLGTRPVRLT